MVISKLSNDRTYPIKMVQQISTPIRYSIIWVCVSHHFPNKNDQFWGTASCLRLQSDRHPGSPGCQFRTSGSSLRPVDSRECLCLWICLWAWALMVVTLQWLRRRAEFGNLQDTNGFLKGLKPVCMSKRSNEWWDGRMMVLAGTERIEGVDECPVCLLVLN